VEGQGLRPVTLPSRKKYERPPLLSNGEGGVDGSKAKSEEKMVERSFASEAIVERGTAPKDSSAAGRRKEPGIP